MSKKKDRNDSQSFCLKSREWRITLSDIAEAALYD